MKKFILQAFILLLLLTTLMVQARTTSINVPGIRFNGHNFVLCFSKKSSESKGYINEYYKNSENYNNWTELIVVHHFPNAYQPIEQAKSLRDYLALLNCPSAIEVDEVGNTALLDFILVDNNKLPVILEFNAFKYEKSSICGTIAIQYAKRYYILNVDDVGKVKKSFMRNRVKYLKQINKIEIPNIVQKDMDNGRYIDHEGIENNLGSELQLE